MQNNLAFMRRTCARCPKTIEQMDQFAYVDGVTVCVGCFRVAQVLAQAHTLTLDQRRQLIALLEKENV